MSKIQNADVKTLAQLQAAGATAAELINDTKIYVTANSINKQLSQAITDGEIGGGSGGGGINFITKGSADFASSTIFVTYKDAAASRPVDGTGGTAAVTSSVTSVSPLSGTKSYLLTKPASNTQGEGWAIPFTVDLAYRAKSVRIEFDYIVNSGTFAAGSQSTDSDVIWYIYDVTNSQLIEPSSIKMLSNNSTLGDKFQATFQTSATGSSYRLIAHCATTSALAYELKVDNIQVGPQEYVYGTPVTDWISYTPTITATTTNPTKGGTILVDQARWRRVGDSMEIQYAYRQSLAGSAGSGTYLVSLPSGYTIDTAKLYVGTATNAPIGTFQVGAGSQSGPGVAIAYTSTQIAGAYVTDVNAYNYWGSSFGAFSNTNLDFGFSIRVPILGWSSSVQMSDSADTRVVAYANAVSSFSALTGGAWAVIPTASWSTPSTDTVGGYDGAGGYVVRTPGIYRLSTLVGTGAGTSTKSVRFTKNNVAQTTIGAGTTQAYSVAVGSSLIQAVAGDVFRLEYQNFAGTESWVINAFTVDRLSGPSAIAATESVNAKITSSISIPDNSQTQLSSFVQVFSSHGGVGGNSYTFQSSGVYRLSIFTEWQATVNWNAAGKYASLRYQINSGPVQRLNEIPVNNNSAAFSLTLTGETIERVVGGDLLKFYLYQNTGGAMNQTSTILIERIGN